MNSIKDLLIAARALIADPEKWTQGELAIEDTGCSCAPNDPDAYAFCALGALAHIAGVEDVARDDTAAQAALALENAAFRLFNPPKDLFSMAALVNDGELLSEATPLECHAAVLDMYDAAIAAP